MPLTIAKLLRRAETRAVAYRHPTAALLIRNLGDPDNPPLATTEDLTHYCVLCGQEIPTGAPKADTSTHADDCPWVLAVAIRFDCEPAA